MWLCTCPQSLSIGSLRASDFEADILNFGIRKKFGVTPYLFISVIIAQDIVSVFMLILARSVWAY